VFIEGGTATTGARRSMWRLLVFPVGRGDCVSVNGAQIEWCTPKSHESRSVPLPRFLGQHLTLTRGRQRRTATPTASDDHIQQALATMAVEQVRQEHESK
jgi:hypothetical protein